MRSSICNKAWSGFIGLCALTTVACTWADDAFAETPPVHAAVIVQKGATVAAGWGAAVSDPHLDAVRGGFDMGTGLLVSFGIDRAVYVNGNLVTSTSLYIPNIGQMSAEQAGALAAATSTISVVQNGPGNTVDPSALAQATAGTVVQNSLNNQNIQTLTTLNTTVNTLNLFKSLNLQSTLQTALINSLGH